MCRCSRCSLTNVETESYYMEWSHDVRGYFEMCDACVELYKQYIVEDPTQEEEDPSEEEDE